MQIRWVHIIFWSALSLCGNNFIFLGEKAIIYRKENFRWFFLDATMSNDRDCVHASASVSVELDPRLFFKAAAPWYDSAIPEWLFSVLVHAI